jgi:hypothetical protein
MAIMHHANAYKPAFKQNPTERQRMLQFPVSQNYIRKLEKPAFSSSPRGGMSSSPFSHRLGAGSLKTVLFIGKQDQIRSER